MCQSLFLVPVEVFPAANEKPPVYSIFLVPVH